MYNNINFKRNVSYLIYIRLKNSQICVEGIFFTRKDSMVFYLTFFPKVRIINKTLYYV